MQFSLQSIESSDFNEVVQIDHQKICMTDSGYNQVLVMIDHFTKFAEAVPCITASAEETCGHLINTWIARHGCPMTFQSDNGTAFVGKLTKDLMRRSQVAQAHSTTYHPQTNGLVERQNRTLVSMLRVYCSRYMTDWDRYLSQVMGAYNSTQHSTTGVTPHMRVMKTYLKARYRLSDLLRAQRNDRLERQNRTLVSMLRVYCSWYMTDWDRYLPQVMGAYNSTQHSTTGVSPHMMLAGHEKSLPLTFFYPEYEGEEDVTTGLCKGCN